MVTSKEKLGHEARDDRKVNGATYTPGALASAIARRMTTKMRMEELSGKIRILDPGVGNGALIKSFLETVKPAYFDRIEITAIDISRTAIDDLRHDLIDKYPQVSFRFLVQDFFSFYNTIRGSDTLFDLVLANPPYVRTQALDEEVRERLRKAFGLPGRADLSFSFLAAISRLLSKGGMAAVITSNKILTTEAGRGIRVDLEKNVCLQEIWDLGDTRLFDAAVLPCVMFFRAGDPQTSEPTVFRSIYKTGGVECQDFAGGPSEAVMYPGKWRLMDGSLVEVRSGGLSRAEGWRLADAADQEWAARVTSKTWAVFGDVGHVRVGIKTTADKIFIPKDWSNPPPELLRPLLTHHVAGRYRASIGDPRFVLYTHEVRESRRMPVDIDQYPVSKAHLERHRQRLEGRDYVQKAGRKWFEIWVPHDPEAWQHPKIVFRDIAERPTFWMDMSGAVVNGDCYWIQLRSDLPQDILWLMLAVANSSVIEKYYDVVLGERLYAGRRRFMTRHVCKFPLPDPTLKASVGAARIARRLAKEDMADAQRADLERCVDDYVTQAFGL